MNKLSKGAYGGVEGTKYEPYIKPNHGVNETSVKVLIVGIILAMLFAASNAYTAITAGMTVAAGIPGAILGGGILGILSKDNSVLNTNVVQGMSSAGESIASGITFVLPAVFLVGSQVGFFQGVLVGVGGALLGIAITSLVHNYLIIEEHGTLVYPEGMAISETLVTTSTGGEGLKIMGVGFAISSIFVLISEQITGLVSNVFAVSGTGDFKWQWQTEANPLLLGIGFIVGIEVAMAMFAGSVLANFGIIPLIGVFTANADASAVAWNNPDLHLTAMAAGDIQGTYTKYIGAGMMLAGGLIGAIKLIPVIVSSIKETLGASNSVNVEETSGEKSYMGLLLIGGLGLIVISSFVISSGIPMAIITAVLIVIFSFLFSIVAARMTGDIGTSNLPVSGMTIASLLIVTVVFLIIGNVSGNEAWTNTAGNVTILMALTAVVTAISTSGGYAQTQKATFIIGGNKSGIQKTYALAAMFGVVASIAAVILLAPMYMDNPGMAPQANLMASITQGILSHNLPWAIIFVGICFAVVLFLLELPIMTIAIGFYLPISTVSIIMIGALIKVLIQKTTKDEKELTAKEERGTIFSSGLVAGGAIIGLFGAALSVLNPGGITAYPFYFGGEEGALLNGNLWSLVTIAALVVIVYLFINSKGKGKQ